MSLSGFVAQARTSNVGVVDRVDHHFVAGKLAFGGVKHRGFSNLVSRQ